MEDTTIRRYSSGLVLVGFLILVPATLWLVVMGMFVLTTVFATAPRSQADLMKQARRDTVRELQGIRGLPAVVVTEFEREGQPREATLKALRPQQRQQVQEALAQYHGAVAGASLWPVIGALAGGWLAWLLFAMPAIPVAIVGLVLTRKRKVGRCSLCGYAFDRT